MRTFDEATEKYFRTNEIVQPLELIKPSEIRIEVRKPKKEKLSEYRKEEIAAARLKYRECIKNRSIEYQKEIQKPHTELLKEANEAKLILEERYHRGELPKSERKRLYYLRSKVKALKEHVPHHRAHWTQEDKDYVNECDRKVCEKYNLV